MTDIGKLVSLVNDLQRKLKRQEEMTAFLFDQRVQTLKDSNAELRRSIAIDAVRIEQIERRNPAAVEKEKKTEWEFRKWRWEYKKWSAKIIVLKAGDIKELIKTGSCEPEK